MKKILVIISFMSLLTLTSCDMFRSLAGRPTSSEIEALRSELQEKERCYQAKLDSLEAEKKFLADSLATIDSLQQLGGTILSLASQGPLFTTKLESRYYLVVGSFMMRNNAEKLVRRINSTGRYNAAIISLRNGYNVVAVSPSNTLKDALKALKAVKKEKFCPSDVWVLVNE